MIKFIIARGIGFAPGSVKYIPTLRFSFSAAPAVTFKPWEINNLKMLRILP